jgi:hypothetical protein
VVAAGRRLLYVLPVHRARALSASTLHRHGALSGCVDSVELRLVCRLHPSAMFSTSRRDRKVYDL